MIGGDLNEILWNHEKLGGSSRDSRLLEDFHECLEDCKLLDLGYHGNPFTWYRSWSNGTQIFERLDRFLGNEAFCELFKDIVVTHLDWTKSDHRLIVLELVKEDQVQRTSRRVRGFKFDEHWASYPECREIIAASGHWGSSSGRQLPLEFYYSVPRS